MSEFNNRIVAQRAVLEAINAHSWPAEKLFGLSSKAIDRWLAVNGIPFDSVVVQLLKTASAKLFFLANKSQEQVTDEYKGVAKEVGALTIEIRNEILRLQVRAIH
jgi:hypothetical protein